MGRKKTEVIVLSLIVIAALAVLVTRIRKETSAPREVLSQPVELIDQKTLKVVTLPAGELKRREDGTYLNKDTGEYTLTSVTICPQCGEKIPSLVMPAPKPGESAEEHQAAYERMMGQWKCPKCGGKVVP